MQQICIVEALSEVSSSLPKLSFADHLRSAPKFSRLQDARTYDYGARETGYCMAEMYYV